jgi:preprotein translocase SecE subunit
MKFDAYKPGQGRLSRGIAAGGAGVLLLYGCYRAYWFLHSYVWAGTAMGGMEVPGIGTPLSPGLLITVALVLGSAYFVYYALNRPDLADLLIETESEMRKVTWPTLEEAKNSSLVVVVCVVVMALLITVFDMSLHWVFRLVGIS